MTSKKRFAAVPGRWSDRSADALEPSLEELLRSELLLDHELARSMIACRLGEPLGHLGSGPAVEELPATIAILPAEVGDARPATIGALVDATFAGTAPSFRPGTSRLPEAIDVLAEGLCGDTAESIDADGLDGSRAHQLVQLRAADSQCVGRSFYSQLTDKRAVDRKRIAA